MGTLWVRIAVLWSGGLERRMGSGRIRGDAEMSLGCIDVPQSLGIIIPTTWGIHHARVSMSQIVQETVEVDGDKSCKTRLILTPCQGKKASRGLR